MALISSIRNAREPAISASRTRNKLDTDRLLWPERPVIVEYRDAIGSWHEIRRCFRRDAPHKIHETRLRRAFVPRGKRVSRHLFQVDQ